MGAVAQGPCDRHRKAVALRLEGRRLAEIALELRYASPQVVANVLSRPDVRAYHERLRARLEDSLTDASRWLLSDVVEFSAVPKRQATA